MIKLRNLLLLVRPEVKQNEEKVGSLFIPKTAKSKFKQPVGTVIAVGKGTSQFKMEVQIGDRVVYDNRKDYVTIDDNLLLKQSDVLFILNEDGK